MEGRRIRSLVLSALTLGSLSALGCRTTKDNGLPPATLPMPNNQQKSGLFGFNRSGQQFAPPPDAAAVRPVKKSGKGVKPETEVIWADTEVDAAILEGRSDDERNKLLDSARAKYQKALASDPKNKAALVGLGRLYAKAGDRERAMQSMTQALQLDPKDHSTALKMAKVQSQFGDWRGACQSCEYALNLDPENRGYRKIYGFCLANGERWEEAFAALQAHGFMSEADARCFLAHVLFDKNRLQDGGAQLELALKADPNHQEARAILEDMMNPEAADPVANPVANPNPIRTVGGTNDR